MRKIIPFFIKSCREQLRDYWTLILSISSAPFFVLLYFLLFGGGTTSYNIVVINHDKDFKGHNAGNEVMEKIANLEYENGNKMLKLIPASDSLDAVKKIEAKDAVLLMVIQEDFSQNLLDINKNKDTVLAEIKLVGDKTNPYYSIAAILASSAMESYVYASIGAKRQVEYNEKFIGPEKARTEFEMYVPGLLIFSIIILIYTASVAVIKEVEEKTIRRIMVAPVSSFSFLAGISLSQTLLGAVSVSLTLLFSVALGFNSEGSILLTAVIAILSTFSIVAVSLIVAAFAKNVSSIMAIGTFPMFLLMWFSGSVYPMPKTALFSAFGHQFSWTDFLPPTHAVNAVNKITGFGAGFSDVLFEVIALLLLIFLYFVVGVYLFKRKHLASIK